MEIGESWIGRALSKRKTNGTAQEIENVTRESALAKGENYLSQITRITADVIVTSGEKERISCIAKDQLESPHLKQMSVDAGFFLREIEMYRDVLPKMESLMREMGDTGETLWPECYDYRLYDQIVLEDLKASDYHMADRRKQLDLAHALFVVRSLAKFHAISRVLYKRSQLPINIFGKIFWAQNPVFAKEELDNMLLKLANALDQWGNEWSEAKLRLEKAIPSIWLKVEEFFNSRLDGFSVLNHGDCWTNNLLFRYGSDAKTPVSMKIVDFQLTHWGTPVHDLHWFLSSSVPMSVRKEHVDLIIAAYSQSLTDNLRKFGYKDEIPSAKVIREHYERYKVLQLWYTVLLAPGVLAESKAAYDIEEIIREAKEAKSQGQQSTFNAYICLAELPKSVIQGAIRDAMVKQLI